MRLALPLSPCRRLRPVQRLPRSGGAALRLRSNAHQHTLVPVSHLSALWLLLLLLLLLMLLLLLWIYDRGRLAASVHPHLHPGGPGCLLCVVGRVLRLGTVARQWVIPRVPCMVRPICVDCTAPTHT